MEKPNNSDREKLEANNNENNVIFAQYIFEEYSYLLWWEQKLKSCTENENVDKHLNEIKVLKDEIDKRIKNVCEYYGDITTSIIRIEEKPEHSSMNFYSIWQDYCVLKKEMIITVYHEDQFTNDFNFFSNPIFRSHRLKHLTDVDKYRILRICHEDPEYAKTHRLILKEPKPVKHLA